MDGGASALTVDLYQALQRTRRFDGICRFCRQEMMASDGDVVLLCDCAAECMFYRCDAPRSPRHHTSQCAIQKRYFSDGIHD